MKKTVLFAAALVAASAASAQTGEITSNRGENWLSQDGDWGLTFDAQPFLNYAGNLFNGTSGNNVGNGFNWLGTNSSANPLLSNSQMFAITGKKLIDANTAYRGKLRIGFGSKKETFLVDVAPLPNPGPVFPNPNPTVEDVTKQNNMNIVLGAGLEKRVGSTRVVGIYGAEAYVMFGNGKTTNEYGNALSQNNQGAAEGRVTESKNGSTFGLGVGAFAGVEWFCAPKISLSGEYTWGLMMSSKGMGETTTEYWVSNDDGTNGTVTSVTVEGAPNDGQADKTNTFGIDTGISGASIGINFYFQ